jgi:ABC-type multidrug transport system ATPase subunit
VERGQVFSLLGPNGSGKSSLIKTLLQNAVPHTVDRLSVLGQSDPALVSLVEQEDIKVTGVVLLFVLLC